MHHLNTTIYHTSHLTIAQPPSLTPSPPPLSPGVAHGMVFHRVFYWGRAHEILFPGWPGSSTGMYVLAVFFVFFLAVLVECLSYCRFVKPGSNRVAACFFRSGMHAVRAGFAYMVLLAVITYNGGVFIAAIVGHAVGYLIFGSGLCWNKAEDGSSSRTVEIGPTKF